MGLLIDTSVFIAHERGELELSTQLGSPNESVLLSAITASELLHGVHRADTPARAKQRSAFVEAILDRFPVVGIDVAVAREHARIWAHLVKKGTPIPAHDLWIGAQALVLDFEVLTVNVRDFKRIPGLRSAWRPPPDATCRLGRLLHPSRVDALAERNATRYSIAINIAISEVPHVQVLLDRQSSRSAR